MKRAGKLALILVLLVVTAAQLEQAAFAQNTQDFKINSFVADYYLDRNAAKTSLLHATEAITAEFPAYDQNHGILRALPETYLGHTVSLDIISVTDENGVAQPYSTYGQNGNEVIKIGDKNTFVHGVKTYKITYDQKNVVNILADHDEFYWDVNGDQWNQPLGEVTARLHVPPNLVNELQARNACYVGYYGASDSSRCQINPIGSSGSMIITSTAKNLAAGETMTIVSGFNSGTFKLGPEIAAAKRAKIIKYALIAGAVAAPALLAGIFLYTQWIRFGRDPKGRGVIIPEYQPPKGLSVLTNDYVFEEKLNTKAISAQIVELAVSGYLNIIESVKKKRLAKDRTLYSLRLVKDTSDLPAEQQKVVEMFFGGHPAAGSVIELENLRNSMADDVKALKKSLGNQLTASGYFKNNPETATTRYYAIGGVLALGGFFLLTTGLFPLIALSVALAGVMFVIFSRYMPSRSQNGVTVHDHMLGLRDYIKLAEADRLNYLQSPQGAEKIQEYGLDPKDPKFKVKLFESLLPYAMVFNLEKDWSKQFENLYKEPPGWYSGNWSTFNAVYLASSINGFSSFNSVNFAPPRSSGSSGFGGGGFSGGGGGGGGGGGW